MFKIKSLKYLLSAVMIICILNALIITSFADSNKTVKSDTCFKLNDRPAENVQESKEDYKTDNQAIDDSGFNVKVNDELINFPDAKPFMDKNIRIQVPVKIIGEALGAKVSWNSKTKQVIFLKEDDRVVFTIGKNEYTLNGEVYKMETSAIIKDNRTFVPVDFIADALGANILTDISMKTVSISFVIRNGYTKDGLEIYCFDGKEYMFITDVEEKYKCSVIGDSVTNAIEIYGEEGVAAWDLDYTKPLIETESYVTKGDFNYFELGYYENKIIPILTQPRETSKPSYKKNGLDIYLYNGKEYILPGDIAILLNKDVLKYLFQDISDKKFNFVKLKEEGNVFCEDFEVIIPDISATVVYGRLSIEYEYFINFILPKVEKWINIVS